jgi:hypothetical protein
MKLNELRFKAVGMTVQSSCHLQMPAAHWLWEQAADMGQVGPETDKRPKASL